jgi:hypothetical protein
MIVRLITYFREAAIFIPVVEINISDLFLYMIVKKLTSKISKPV